MLACPSHRGADLAVQEVGRGDADGLDVGVGYDHFPVAGGGGEAELPRSLLGPAGHVVDGGDQHWLDRQLREVVQHAGVRLGVDTAHPAETDDRYSERLPLVDLWLRQIYVRLNEE
jgi:hypothetical protein